MSANKFEIPCRTFLKGTSSALGLAVLGIAPQTALAGARKLKALKTRSLSVAFWNETRFIPADRLGAGDMDLSQVRITIRSHGRPGQMKSIDVLSYASGKSGNVKVPFQAWVAPPHGCAVVKFIQHIDPESGL